MNKLIGLLALLTFSFSALASDRGTVKFHSLTDGFTEKTTEFVKITGMDRKLDINVSCNKSGQAEYTFYLQVGMDSNHRFNRASTFDVRNPDNMILERNLLAYASDTISLVWGDVTIDTTPNAIPILLNAILEAELIAAQPDNNWSHHIRIRVRSGSNTETDSFKVTGFKDELEKLNCG